MKNFTKLFLGVAALVAFGFGVNAQTTIDFESVQGGNAYVWAVFGGGTPPTYTLVANPAAGGVNSTAHVGKFVTVAGGSTWDGLWTAQPSSPWVISNTNKIVKVQVYKSVIGKFQVKLENTGPNDAVSVIISNTKVNQWEELVFNFTSNIGFNVKKLVLLPNVDGTTACTTYFDNISFTDGTATALSSIVSENGVKLFPNPASNNVTVVATSELSEVKISNLLGQTVQTVSVSGLEATVALSNLAAGQYIVIIKSADGTVSTQKLVKK